MMLRRIGSLLLALCLALSLLPLGALAEELPEPAEPIDAAATAEAETPPAQTDRPAAEPDPAEPGIPDLLDQMRQALESLPLPAEEPEEAAETAAPSPLETVKEALSRTDAPQVFTARDQVPVTVLEGCVVDLPAVFPAE